jgi:hypothetical protein
MNAVYAASSHRIKSTGVKPCRRRTIMLETMNSAVKMNAAHHGGDHCGGCPISGSLRSAASAADNQHHCKHDYRYSNHEPEVVHVRGVVRV